LKPKVVLRGVLIRMKFLTNFFDKMKRKKETNETYKITCPECNKSYQYPYSPEERDGWTTDCIKCNALLVFEGNKVHNFHKWLHAKTEGDEYQWPIDGQGTGYVDIQ